jgi:hypothetical protein
MATGAQVRDDVALLVEVHVCSSGQRGFFAEVEEGLAPVRQLNGHETAAPQVARRGINHRQCITDRYRGVDGVTAVLEHIDAHVTGQMLGGNNHAVFGRDRRHGGRVSTEAAERQ